VNGAHSCRASLMAGWLLIAACAGSACSHDGTTASEPTGTTTPPPRIATTTLTSEISVTTQTPPGRPTAPTDHTNDTTPLLFTNWPQPTEPVKLSEAPYLLAAAELQPTHISLETVPYDSLLRNAPAYIQQYVTSDGNTFVTIKSNPGIPFAAPPEAKHLPIADRNEAVIIKYDGRAVISFGDATGSVEVSVGTSADAVLVSSLIASSLVPRPAGQAGWNVVQSPTGSASPALTPLSEGWLNGWQRRREILGASHEIEIAVDVGNPALFDLDLTNDVSIVNLSPGTVAVAQQTATSGSVVTWRTGVGVTASVMTRGSVEETLATGLALKTVDEQTWLQASSRVDVRTEIGCSEFFSEC